MTAKAVLLVVAILSTEIAIAFLIDKWFKRMEQPPVRKSYFMRDMK